VTSDFLEFGRFRRSPAAELAALKEGDTLTVTGPCGNGFAVAAITPAAGGTKRDKRGYLFRKRYQKASQTLRRARRK